jgi:hypothetical protein
MLEAISGMTRRRSCLYRPGATKAQAWYSRKGMARKTAAASASLKGVRNGDATCVAIMLVPAGSCAMRGPATVVKIQSANGTRQMKIRSTATTILRSRVRSSTR